MQRKCFSEKGRNQHMYIDNFKELKIIRIEAKCLAFINQQTFGTTYTGTDYRSSTSCS